MIIYNTTNNGNMNINNIAIEFFGRSILNLHGNFIVEMIGWHHPLPHRLLHTLLRMMTSIT